MLGVGSVILGLPPWPGAGSISAWTVRLRRLADHRTMREASAGPVPHLPEPAAPAVVTGDELRVSPLVALFCETVRRKQANREKYARLH